jgi:hypothetical protein
MKPKRSVDVYLTLKRPSRGWESGEAKLVSAHTNPPTARPRGTCVVKVKIIVPDAAFDPAKIPALVADVPLDLVSPPLEEFEAVPEQVES